CSIRGINFSLTPPCRRSIRTISSVALLQYRTGRVCMFLKPVLFAVVIPFLITWPDPAFAQARDTASLFGTVTDAQASVVPGARVTLTNIATGLSRNTVTDNSGGFVFPLLPVGSYNMSVEQTGFRKYERRNILLQANENVNVAAALEVGNVQETVTVEATAAQVDTRSATLQNTVDSKRMVELPLNGRNPADLALLSPGVASGAGNNS